MRQTLFYIPSEIFGVPVFGVGIALVLLILAVSISSVWQYCRNGKLGEDLWSYGALLLVGAAVLVFVAPNVLEPQGFPIRGYGVCLLVAILASLALVLKLAQVKGISSDLIFSLCLWAVVSGILGARLFYIVEYWPEMAVHDPGTDAFRLGPTLYNIVNIANGGLVVFGSILGGALGSLIFMIRSRMPVLATFDLMAPAMMLGISIGRIGCFLNGCCYGGVSDMCWAVEFPQDSPAHVHQMEHGQIFFYGLKFKEETDHDRKFLSVSEVQPGSDAEKAGMKQGMILRGMTGMLQGRPQSWQVETVPNALLLIYAFEKENPGEILRFDVYANPEKTETRPYFIGPSRSPVLPVHPTQIYSSLAAATGCVILLILGKRPFFRAREGLVFAVFLLLYSVGRFLLEIIRTDEDSFLGTGLTVSQNVSIGVFFAGLVLLVYLLKAGKTLPPKTSDTVS